MWFVADPLNPERRYSMLDPNNFPSEFGPFETKEEAEQFAEIRSAYVVVEGH